MKSLTDCLYFMNGHCKFGEQCHFRHSLKAKKQLTQCVKWPDLCRKIQCSFRHPVIMAQPKVTTSNSLKPLTSKDNLVSFFWNIENVPIPKEQKPFDIIQRIRKKLVAEPGLQEATFSCFCNIYTISNDNQQSLHNATVRIIHVPDRKPGAIDRQIMLELDRFERVHRSPATIVLISGDIDFVGKLSDLRHQAGFQVMVIHNKPATEELKATVNAYYSWELFTNKQTTMPITRDSHCNRNQREYESANCTSGKKMKRKNVSQGCPICEAEFNTIAQLRQHQEDTTHLFNCPGCNHDFYTQEGQLQHQKAKNHGHYDDKHSSTQIYTTDWSHVNKKIDDEDAYSSDSWSTIPDTDNSN
ncbi:unnamed protein product [Rotaria sp. Silwood2]|nr:unnamed protein product [Rotaria sp. Silwood2]